MSQMKWKMIVVACFVTATVDLLKQRLVIFMVPFRRYRRYILWMFVVVWLFVKWVKGNLTLSDAMDNLVYNLLGGLLLPD